MHGRNTKSSVKLEIIFAVLLFATGILLRSACIGNIEFESVYYDLAKVTDGQGIPAVAHKTEFLYLHLLRLLFVVFGNKFIVAVWLQIVLQVGAGAFLYLAVRKFTKVIPAMILLGVMMLTPMIINRAVILSPENLFLFLISIVIFIFAKILCKTLRFVGKKTKVESAWEDGTLEEQLEAMSIEVIDMETESPEEVAEPPKVKFIENPLPLPKKHVKKVLDFDRELEEGQDDFDIAVDENDDYDI